MKNKSKENPTCTGRSVKQTLRFLLCIALLLAAPKAGAENWIDKADTKWYVDQGGESTEEYKYLPTSNWQGWRSWRMMGKTSPTRP